MRGVKVRHPPLTRLRFASAAACDDNLIDADDYLSDVETGDDDDQDDATTPSRQSPLGPASGCHRLLPEQQLGQNWNELNFFSAEQMEAGISRTNCQILLPAAAVA